MSSQENGVWKELEPVNENLLQACKRKKPRLYADACIPFPIVQELRANGIDIQRASEEAKTSLPDTSMYAMVRKRRRVLLTVDCHFWDDKKHPLQKGPGVIFLDIAPDEFDESLSALVAAWVYFIRIWPNDCWSETKIRVYDGGFIIKCHTWDGKVSEDEYCLQEHGHIMTRCIR